MTCVTCRGGTLRDTALHSVTTLVLLTVINTKLRNATLKLETGPELEQGAVTPPPSGLIAWCCWAESQRWLGRCCENLQQGVNCKHLYIKCSRVD